MPQLDFGHYAHQSFYFFFVFSIIYLFSTFYILPLISSLIKLAIKKTKKNLEIKNLSLLILQNNQSELVVLLNKILFNVTIQKQIKKMKQMNPIFYSQLAHKFASVNKI